MAEDVFENLKKFGLTSYEIKAYRALLLNGPMTPMETVSVAGIPQPRIYDVLQSLLSEGLIEVSPGKKKIYRAKDVKSAFSSKLAEMSIDLEKISKEASRRSKTTEGKNPLIWMVQSESKIRVEMRKMIDQSADELILSLKYELLHRLRKNIRAALDRGVLVVIVVFPDTNLEDISDLQAAAIKQRKGFASEVIISDRTSSIIKIDNGNYDQNYAIAIEEDEIIHITSYYFYHTIWTPSINVREFPLRSPLRVRTSWLACEILDRQLQSGSQVIKGTVYGRMKGKEVSITGNITRVEIEPGYKHTFYISRNKAEYSVGGKSARIEDIAMTSVHLRLNTT